MPRESAQGGTARLEITALSLPAPDHFGTALHEVSLSVTRRRDRRDRRVAGNGQGELFDAISGERLSPPAAIKIDGVPVGGLGITARRKRGGAFVPEERLGHGAAPRFSLSDNAALTRYATAGMVKIGMLLRSKAKSLSESVIGQFDVRKGAPDPEAGSLSGGNLQKFVVGREVLASPGILVVNQPTWGVDAGAAAVIRQSLIDLAAKGAAVLVISQDLDEIWRSPTASR